jgi:RNA polymerase sigma factor (sigma-70 family)
MALGDNVDGMNPRPLDELLRARWDQFLLFVRWRSAAGLAARRDPEDVVQTAAAAACKRWGQYEQSNMTLEAWFYRLLLDKLLDDHKYHHRKKRNRRLEVAWPDGSSLEYAMGLHAEDTPSDAPPDNDDAEAARVQLRRQIDDTLAALGPKFQTVMVLIHFCELSKAQAAELLGAKAATVRQWYARAREEFRVVWKGKYGEAGAGT